MTNITNIEYSVDTTDNWTTCSATDGTFDSLTEDYSCDISPSLSDGSHIVYVRAVDSINNISDNSVFDSFTVSLSGPVIDTLDNRSEKALFTQNATTTGAISFAWTYTGPGTITFGSSDAEDTTILADTDGNYTITLTVTDTLSRTASESFTLTWDTTAPSIVIGAHNLGAITSPTNSSASISDSGSGMASITWEKVSGPGSINFSPDYTSMNPNFSSTLTGSYVLRVNALDLAGNISSDIVSFDWNGDPATPDIMFPSLGDYLAGGSVYNVTWTSSNEDNLDHFELWHSEDRGLNWILISDSIASTTTSFNWQAPVLNSSSQLLKLTLFNTDGNSTTTISLPFTIDSTLPTELIVINPDAFTLPIKGGESLDISWTGGYDINANETPISIQYSENGSFDDTLTIDTVANSGSYSWTVPFIDTVDSARIRIVSIDLAQNTSTGTSSMFKIDSLAPSLTLTSDFGETDQVFRPNPIISDNIDGDSDLTYYWSSVSSPSGGTLNFSVPFISNPNISANVIGDYSASLTVTDRAGNSVTKLMSFTWTGGSLLPELIYPNSGDYLRAGTSTIIWTVPNISDLDSYTIEHSGDGGVTWTILEPNLPGSATSSTWFIGDDVNLNSNIIKVSAYKGSDTYVANSGIFVIDSSAPSLDLVSSLGTINLATIATASSTDNFSDSDDLLYNWSILSAPAGGNLFISSVSSSSTSLSANVNGDYAAMLSVTDQAGNIATSSVSFKWYIAPTSGGGGGGGGGFINYCSQVEYSVWSSCVNGFQTRSVISSFPANCSLTTNQQIDLNRVCVIDPVLPPEEEPVVSDNIPSDSPFDSEAFDVIEAARNNFTKVDEKMTLNLLGRIVLQVEDKGRAWYVNPIDAKKYYLGRPTNAFQVMRLIGQGISNRNLDKIPVGILDGSLTMDQDTDKDGLPDRLEKGLGSNLNKMDTDGDGYSDYDEIKNDYNILASGKTTIDMNFTKKHKGKIFIQVERNGEAWYIEPISQRRYYLGRPVEALTIMRTLSLGISNENLNKIPVGSFEGLVK